ncbi:hypothetical protein [Streptomyces sp. NPDC054838]
MTLAEAPETADKFDSWAGEGTNEPISGAEIAAQIDPEPLTAVAEKARVNEPEAAARLVQEVDLGGRRRPGRAAAVALGGSPVARRP